MLVGRGVRILGFYKPAASGRLAFPIIDSQEDRAGTLSSCHDVRFTGLECDGVKFDSVPGGIELHTISKGLP